MGQLSKQSKKQIAIQDDRLKRATSRFYNINSILGNDWALFYVITGGRMTGKSYSVTDYICRRKRAHGDDVKAYWLRISETSTKALLANKARNLVDPDLVRKYELELTQKAGVVQDHGKTFMEVYPLSSFGKLKGQAFFDKDFKGEYIIVLDEFQLEVGEKRTSFDILYNFIGMLENIARTTKNKVKVFLLGNTLEEASTILKAFDFLPEGFGRFYLKRKRCVIDNLEPTAEYLKDREGSLADILGGNKMSNYTNALRKDVDLVYKGRVTRPEAIIKFTKSDADWFTLWDGKVIRKYNKEKLPKETDFCMRPYLDSFFSPERKKVIIEMWDVRSFKFDNLITQSYFSDALSSIRK